MSRMIFERVIHPNIIIGVSNGPMNPIYGRQAIYYNAGGNSWKCKQLTHFQENALDRIYFFGDVSLHINYSPKTGPKFPFSLVVSKNTTLYDGALNGTYYNPIQMKGQTDHIDRLFYRNT
jgi:hypothetical protein